MFKQPVEEGGRLEVHGTTVWELKECLSDMMIQDAKDKRAVITRQSDREEGAGQGSNSQRHRWETSGQSVGKNRTGEARQGN